MLLLKRFIGLLLLVEGIECFRIVCVYTNWAQYRPGDGRFLPEDVDPSLCTHLIYVYAKLKGNKLEPAEWNDEGTAWSEGMYQRVVNLKDLNAEMKIFLGVGGWKMGSTDFSRMSATRGSRRMFARSTVKFLRDHKFDGLTIDWQHPTKRGGRPKDKENYSLLLQDLRTAFDNEAQMTGKPSLMLTAGVSASREVIDSAYEIENITKYTDFLNVFAFDLHGDWDNYTGHPSQLYARQEEFGPSTEFNVDAVMRYWMSLVPDVTKLVLGVSTYGRTFTLRRARHTEYNVPSTGPGLEGEYTRQPGMLAYYERCLQYVDAPRVWDPVSQVAYWHSGDQWIAGEDTDSIRAKVNWTRTYQIGGMMIWSLDTDDFKDRCYEGAFSLLKSAVAALKIPLDKNATRPVIPKAVNQIESTPAKAMGAPTTVDYFGSDSVAVTENGKEAQETTTPTPMTTSTTAKSTTATTTFSTTTTTITTSNTTLRTTVKKNNTPIVTTSASTTAPPKLQQHASQEASLKQTEPTAPKTAVQLPKANESTSKERSTIEAKQQEKQANTDAPGAKTPQRGRLTRQQRIKLIQEKRRKMMQNRQDKNTKLPVTQKVINTQQTTTPTTTEAHTTTVKSIKTTQSIPEPTQYQPKPNDKRVNDPAEIQKRRQRIMAMRRQRRLQKEQTIPEPTTPKPTEAPTTSKASVEKVTQGTVNEAANSDGLDSTINEPDISDADPATDPKANNGQPKRRRLSPLQRRRLRQQRRQKQLQQQKKPSP